MELADMEKILDKNVGAFNRREMNCAESTLKSVCEYIGADDKLLPRIATAFGGGMGGSQSVCGAVTGALMALGASELDDETCAQTINFALKNNEDIREIMADDEFIRCLMG